MFYPGPVEAELGFFLVSGVVIEFKWYFIWQVKMDLQTAIVFLPALVVGLTFHEAAHAISAKWLGDDTAERMGRVSLNPMRHMSLMGTAALFVIGFGWGKPVMVNIYNFKKPRFYYLLSSLAGPGANLILGGISLGALYLPLPGYLQVVFVPLFLVNSLLAVFNLLPIPPLDGSKIWPCLIPGAGPVINPKWGRLWLIVLVVLLVTDKVDIFMGPVFGFLFSLLPAGIA